MRRIDSIIPTTYDAAYRALGLHKACGAGKTELRLNANTTLRAVKNVADESDIESESDIALRLHSTDVITFKASGCLVLNSGGWKTVTTKARINAALRGSGHHVFQIDHRWYVSHPSWKTAIEFTDGLIIGSSLGRGGIV